MLSGSIGNSCREVLPTIHEEMRTLSGNYGSNSDSAVLQGMPKMLSNQRGNRTRSKSGGCPRLAACKCKHNKICNERIKDSQNTCFKIGQTDIVQKSARIQDPFKNTKSSSNKAKAGCDSSSLSTKSPLQHPRRNMPNSTLEVRSSTNPQPPLVTKANCGLEVFPAAVLPPTRSRAPDACDLYQKTGVVPQNTHYIGGNMRDTQFQTIKPSESNSTGEDISNNMVGRGGYSEVYRGDLDDGHTIAVKRLTKDNTDENKEKEFLLELEIIGHVNHPNTAILVGCCIENGLHFIFNLSPNGTIASALFDFGLEIIIPITHKYYANPNHPDPISTLTLTVLALLPIRQNLPGGIDISKINFENMSVSESKHFLDLVHDVCLPSSLRDESNNHQNKNQTTCFKMPCMIELQDAGVKFEIRDERNQSMLDIRFEHGHFKIPKFKVTDSTETFFRNIIAYEQHSSDDKPKYFTDYTYFMDQLINCKEEVTQLRCHEVLEGDDEVVALMFNNLGKGRIISEQFFYAEQCSKVNAHCKRWWNKGVASLKRDYFTNIWVIVATIAAAFLLLFTLTQTVIALITIISSPPTLI
ncbi:unnamed protein product [Camellia sinensis]